MNYLIDKNTIDKKSKIELENLELDNNIKEIYIFPDFHYSSKDSIPVGTLFTSDKLYPKITGKDTGCGVGYLKIAKKEVLKDFDKNKHYKALYNEHLKMTPEGLGTGNHFLSLEEDKDNLYIICHTGTRNRGVAFYHKMTKLVDDYNYENKSTGDYVTIEYFKNHEENLLELYNDLLQYSRDRRFNFLIKTLDFLQKNKYVDDREYVRINNYEFLKAPTEKLYFNNYHNGMPYEYNDSIHNSFTIKDNKVIHRKGVTSFTNKDDTIVMPISMTRGCLFVKLNYEYAYNSCSHGAGRKLSRTETLKHWHSLKKKDKKNYEKKFEEMTERNGKLNNGYIQELDFAYKDSNDILSYQPHIRKITNTKPIITIKFNFN